jgi:hypothetical protein
VLSVTHDLAFVAASADIEIALAADHGMRVDKVRR